jgi:hypothetical protein|tara:strand:+ start:126 stop:719 length:594 start_codon:yes stop_codon:yes gene_type:complete
MALKLDIINTALRMVGSYHLDRLDDGSSTYEITSAAFDQAFLEVFGDNIFGYNKKRSKLTGTEILNDDDFSFSFTIPSDLNIYIKAVNGEGCIITDYYTEGATLLCNYPTLTVYYAYIPTDLATLPAYLNKLICLHMAQSIALELSGSENRSTDLQRQYIRALSRARVLSARQGPAQEYISDSTSKFITARRMYGKV